MRPHLVLLITILAAGCGGENDPDPRPASRPETAVIPAPPPDAGTSAGHGADPQRVAVPERDGSPPQATIELANAAGVTLARASQPGPPATRLVTLDEPRLRGTTRGRDANGGVARVRVSLRETLECRGPSGVYTRLSTRYFPPPQIERIRSNPGALLPTTATRSLRLSLSERRCGAGRLTAAHGELWGEAINGSGLEAVTPHLRFAYGAD